MTQQLKKIAVLIDAENASPSDIAQILNSAESLGNVVIRRAYGNWANAHLKGWLNILSQYSIRAIQQHNYVSGKNTADIALTIDAVSLLYTYNCDGFVLVSSDSDFVPLALFLREAGAIVVGAGKSTTISSFQNSCNSFWVQEDCIFEHQFALENYCPNLECIETPILLPSQQSETKAEKKMTSSAQKENELARIHQILRQLVQKDPSHAPYVSEAGSVLHRNIKNFSPKKYGYSDLTGLIQAAPEKYIITGLKGASRYRLR